MKKYLFFLIFFILQNSLIAQTPSQTIRGTIIDKESKSGLPGATVVVAGTDPMVGAVSDVEGNFRIDGLPVGRYTLIISNVGYEARTIPELLVGSGKEIVLSIDLAESLIQMDEIVIKAQKEKGVPQNDMATVSARSFTVEETKRYAASINDPARMALSFAGVSASSDTGNEIIIRGNSPRGLLWRVEGVEIPSPNHFTEDGASGGGVSILSSNMLANSDFLTGAFPAEYGNAFSGVFDIKLRNGNNEKREYAFQAGVLGIDFAAEGPFSKNSKASYLVNYRYSTLALLQKIGVGLDGVPEYQDLSLKVHIPTKKSGSFSIWSLNGLSVSQFIAEKDSTEWESASDRFNSDFRSDMTASGITHVVFLNKEAYLESSLSYSGNKVSFNYDSLDARYNIHNKYHESYINTSIRASTLLNQKLSSRGTLRSGIIASRLAFDLFAQGEHFDTKEFGELVNNEGNTYLLQAYSQYKHRLAENLTINAGLHSMYLTLNGNYTIEPRAGMKWDFLPRQSLSAGIGVHSRIESMSNYFGQKIQDDGSRIYPNKSLDFMKAYHYVLAYDRNMGEDIHLRLETYYQSLKGVPIGPAGIVDPQLRTFSSLNFESGFTTEPLINEGSGRNYGLEITLEKFFTKNYYFMVNNSLFQSKYTPRDGIERNTQFNGNYVSNALLGKEYKVGRAGKNLLSFNLRFTYAGGKRDTPIDLESSIAKNDVVYKYDERFSIRNRDYMRLDTRVSYTINKRRTSSTFSLDLQNATNRANIYNAYYDKELQKVAYNYQLGIIPVLNYRFEF